MFEKREVSKTPEPIAIIGIGCRFPGNAVSPSAFWEMLCKGEDAVSEVPSDRWDRRRFYDKNHDKPGKTYVNKGGFLKERIDLFDPLFFGISPREAEGMDPQQRLLLEVTWEAIEDAGLVADSLAGSPVGVFIGGFCLDNMLKNMSPFNRELIDSHTPASSNMTILANRISHVFDFRGPSITMDTACSSSLVATHLACQSIWRGESFIAVSGGVNVMVRPEYPIIMSKGKFLSEHGHCMAFDERAAGYVRGEGAGIVILKPLSKAVIDKDPIYALIRMTGINQDGHTAGISLPNSHAQEELIRDVYERSGISLEQVAYFEAHGTGTQAGDPAELRAINAVLQNGSGRKDNKCLVGSVKTNIGHLEAAAGIAGIIKAALCLKNRKVPPNLYFENPNPNIPFDDYCVRIPTMVEKLVSKKAPACVSVNSFGYGGTNAHILLEDAPIQRKKLYNNNDLFVKPVLLPISARSENALRELAGKYSFLLNKYSDNSSVGDIIYSSAKRRTHMDIRLAVCGGSTDELKERLIAFSIGEVSPDIMFERAQSHGSGGLVFVFTGMGPQRWGMGAELLKKEPVFLKTIEECDEIFKKMSGWSIIKEFNADKRYSRMKETQVAQPANFAIQIGLTSLWKHYGIRPAAVVGHSVGEVAAAYVAGALSLEDAVAVSYHRSRLQQKLSGKGAMLAVGLSEEDVKKYIGEAEEVSIAAVNSPAALTLAGDETKLNKIAGALENKGIFNRFLKVDIPYHSHHMDLIKDELLSSLANIKARESNVALFSTVEGGILDGKGWGGSYWWNNVRQPVRFADAAASMLDAGYCHFLEVGPHPVLGHSIKECSLSKNKKVYTIGSLRRDVAETLQFRRSLGLLHCMGYDINWDAIVNKGNILSLPSYPWQRERFWKETERSRQDRLGCSGHIFFNERLNSPYPAWQVELNDQFFPYISDHRVLDSAVFPGAGYIEAGLQIHKKIFENHRCILENIQFHNMLVCEMEDPQFLSTGFNPSTRIFSVCSRTYKDDEQWTLHASGTVIPNASLFDPRPIDIGNIKKGCLDNITPEFLYSSLRNRGLNYGKHFRCVKEVWSSGDDFLIKIIGHGSVITEADKEGYLFHPTLLDSAIHTVFATVEGRDPFVLVSIERIEFYGNPGQACWAHSRVTKRVNNILKLDICFFDDDGNVLMNAKDICCQTILGAGFNKEQGIYYSVRWEESDLPVKMKKDFNGSWALFGGRDGSYEDILGYLKLHRVPHILITHGHSYKKQGDSHYKLDWRGGEETVKMFKDIFVKHSIDTVLYVGDINDKGSITNYMDNILHIALAITNIVKAWQSTGQGRSLVLGIVTQMAQAVTEGETDTDVVNACASGLGLLISNEHPDIRCITIDVDNIIVNSEFIVKNILSTGSCSDIAIRGKKRFERRLIYYKADEKDGKEKIIYTSDCPVMLKQHTLGYLNTLRYEEMDRQQPGRGEVEIEIHYSALNFKDCLKAYAKISPKVTDRTFFGENLGMECSGIITSTGENVEGFKHGDPVTACMPGSFKSYATIPAKWVYAKTGYLQLKDSPVFMGYLAAMYGMVWMGRLNNGEKVLIHNASGGVGLAAVQIARMIGADIYATAGSEAKRDYLRSIGISNIMDSRTLEFADKIRETTKGRGVDMVIGAVSGDMLLRSFSLLAPFGRYIDIGKKDISENSMLPMAPFNYNLSFIAVDIDRMLYERMDIINRLAKEISDGFLKGYFQPMPVTVFPASKIEDAFVFMSQGKHIGKVVVDMHKQKVPVSTGRNGKEPFIPRGTAIITGGTKGFGLALAMHLSERGVGQLILLSRSGDATEEAKEAIDEMKKRGTRIIAPKVDVTDEIQVKKAVEEIAMTGLPLKAVFHGAMVLDDGMCLDMNEQRYRNVLEPKVKGVINLHNACKDIKLDYFVCFSSVSSLIGNRGQANYVLANAFLDSFSRYRRALGLPCISINWGVFSETGVVSRDKGVNDILERSGISGFSNREALDSLDYILSEDPVQIGVFDLNWSKWEAANPASVSSYFKYLITDRGQDGKTGKRQEYRIRLKEFSDKDRHGIIEKALCEEFSKVLKVASDRLDVNKGIDKLGVDSLLTLELSMVLKLEFGVLISPMDFIKEPTISQLSDFILDRLLQN